MPRRPTTRQQVSTSFSIPAPVGGWNAKDNIASMPVTDAIILDNYLPKTDKISSRTGFTSFSTGFSGNVESLLDWNGTSTSKFFAASSGNIYDISSGGAIGAPVVTALTNNRWQHVNFGNLAGSNFLVICNGFDAVRNFDGTTWTTPVITGVSSSALINVNVFKQRLFFVEKNTLACWYLPLNSIAGAATKLDFSGLASKGGNLVAMATWTIDGGVGGTDDLAVFITSKGQAIIYRGTDPTSSSWSIVGIFDIAPPIGFRCYVRYGSDLYLILTDGFYSANNVLRSNLGDSSIALSDKIRGAYVASSKSYSSLFGWEARYYPAGQYLLVNIPTSTTQSQQYVVNVINKSWCRFTGQNALCWGLYDERLYFGSSGVVFRADSGLSDNNAAIPCLAKQAFSYFNVTGRQKQFKMYRPIIESDATVNISSVIDVDYQDSFLDVGTSSFVVNLPSWDTTSWDEAFWGGTVVQFRWINTGKIGYSCALKIGANVKDYSFSWIATDYLYEAGGVL